MNDKIIKVSLSKIDAFKEHSFLVNNDSSSMELGQTCKKECAKFTYSFKIIV